LGQVHKLPPITSTDCGRGGPYLTRLVCHPRQAALTPSGRLRPAVARPSPTHASQRKLIIAQAAAHRLPAVYPFRYDVADGGLISYGPDSIDPYRRAAAYVDRILKDEKPGSLAVQAPVKYELVINLKTARALGLEIPPTLLARADEVIE
jgi:putative tryptophan/tyrosine transport system substrate-binding protein